MKKRVDLNGSWHLQYQGSAKREIRIPCAVEQAMENRDFYGPFIFTKRFEMESLPEKNRAAIRFEGVSYACSVFCNGEKVCEHEGIWDGFWADITQAVREGENLLEVEVRKPDFDKESPYFFRSVLFGFIPDVMLPFGGIWRDVTLYSFGETYLKKLVPEFSMAHQAVLLHLEAADAPGVETEALSLRIELTAPDGKQLTFHKPYQEKVVLPVEEISCWSPETPNRYRGTLYLTKGESILDSQDFKGGFRNIKVEHGEIVLNGTPFYMRGVLHWGCYPEKMTPNPSYEEAKEELIKIKELGFNTVKHCLYFPPSYYYELCDELGIVTWQELPLWLPYPNEFLEDRIFNQYPKMLDCFLPYPGVSIVSIGCELDATISGHTLNLLYQMIKEREEQMVICDNSGSGECFEGDGKSVSDIYDYHFYAELYQLNGLIREFTNGSRKEKPWLFGEFNDFDTMRILKNSKKEWWMEPDERKNLLRMVHKGFGSDQPIYRQQEIFRQYGIEEEAGKMVSSSTEQMQEVRKFILETTRSCPVIKGYNITTIRDVPITTAGILDDAVQSKVSKEFMKQINGQVTAAFQKGLSRIWESEADCFCNKDRYHYLEGEKLNGRLVLSNRSPKAVKGEAVLFLKKQGKVLASEKMSCFVEPLTVQELDETGITIPLCSVPCRYELELVLQTEDGDYKNRWDIWGYPQNRTKQRCYLWDNQDNWKGVESLFQITRIWDGAQLEDLLAGDILITTSFEQQVQKTAARGIQVICAVKGSGYLPTVEVPFYREGVTRIEPHPVLDRLCHKGYAGLQFFGIAGCRQFDKLELERVIGSYKSLIRRYDTRKFHAGEYLVEFPWEDGNVLATTLNFDGGKGEQPHNFSHNRLAVWMLHEMILYLGEKNNEQY